MVGHGAEQYVHLIDPIDCRLYTLWERFVVSTYYSLHILFTYFLLLHHLWTQAHSREVSIFEILNFDFTLNMPWKSHPESDNSPEIMFSSLVHFLAFIVEVVQNSDSRAILEESLFFFLHESSRRALESEF